jgi:outer membrane lipoprotein-sorting protein
MVQDALCVKQTKQDKEIIRQARDYLNGISTLYAEFTQENPDRTVITGDIYLSKAQKKHKVKIVYEESIKQEILINNGIITITDKKTGEKTSYSIAQTPLYSILSANIDLTRERCTVLHNDKEYAEIEIAKSTMAGDMKINLAFSKYPNGNIKRIEGWKVSDQAGPIRVNLLPRNMSINDPRKIKGKI